jgi:hypothetical protein
VSAISRRKKEEGRRKKEEGRRKKEELISCTLVNKAVRGGRDTQPTSILNYCGTGRKSC